jgi:GT2 family glycosyltransferase
MDKAGKFAAFIMTYERPEEVLSMVQNLMSQTRPPEIILVVDNSDTTRTAAALKRADFSNVRYHRVGRNSGPAGAAYWGLKFLAEDGYDWIYWGDDDDPPGEQDDFERLFEVIDIASKKHKVGIVGKGAGRLDRLTGKTSSFRNKQLSDGIMECDFVPGNNTSLISGELARKGILPSVELFFGFEELDFCLKVTRAGYAIVFDAGSFLRRRMASGKTDPNYKWKGRSIGVPARLWRQYYSARNILTIFAKNGLWVAMIITAFRIAVRSIYGFRFGLQYGRANFKIQWLAIWHFFTQKLNKFDLSGILPPA